jgi:hypothetical protein
MKRIRLKSKDYIYKSLKIQVEFVNNYFDDNDFIDIVYSAEMTNEFECASYETTEECKEYLDMFFNVFADFIDSKFQSKLTKELVKFSKKFEIE